MSEKIFDPKSPEYKKVSHLPEDQQKNFADFEGGFARKAAVDEITSKGNKIYSKEGEKKFRTTLEEDAIKFNDYFDNKNFFINEAPKLIQEQDFETGVISLAKRLGTEVHNNPNSSTKMHILEDLSRKTLEITNVFDKDAKVLLEAEANLVINIKDVNYMSWSHSVCHLIETYGRYDSYLDTPQSREVLTKLVDESVKRQKETWYDIGCTDRIVGPIVKFNLAEANFERLEKPYEYKPESLNDKEYQKILNKELNKADIKAFLSSDSPLEFYRLTLEQGDRLPDFLTPEQQVKLLQSLEKHLPHDLIDSYVKKLYNPNGKSISYDELIANFQESKEAHEVTKGVYVDVEGTLIDRSRKLDEKLVEALKELINDGREVVIFTGGNISEIEEELKRLGIPDNFLPVHSKNDYRGKVLEILVDDTPPEYQGFKTLKLYGPYNAAYYLLNK